MATPERMQILTRALRDAASRAAEIAGGGCALLFAGLPGELEEEARSRLRAAAGFDSVDVARGAASAIMAKVTHCIDTKETVAEPGDGAMGPRGAGGVVLMPLAIDDRIHGVLAAGSPEPLQAAQSEALELLASTAAVHIDHLELNEELARLRRSACENENLAHEKSDELLKLSETLFAQDIELLRSNEKLGQIEKVKSDFIEKMSRELRTPLNSIIESTISVLAGENETLSDGAKESLRLALDEGTTFQRTLQNILDLWRIKQGEMPVEIQDLNFSEVIDEAIFSVQDTLKGKPVNIEKQLAETFPKVKTDLAKVNQVLFLLLENAAKFTSNGRIEITAGVEDGMLHCEIHDTGIGICPDDQQYIFDEFFQVDERTSTYYRGAGLGLSLARDILALLDGECRLKSEPGQGTSAIFEIPVQLA